MGSSDLRTESTPVGRQMHVERASSGRNADEAVTQADFARRSGVTRACVAVWIKRGLIHGAAVTGKGRDTRIMVKLAQKQLRANRDPAQALGNGAKTRIGAVQPDEEDEERPIGPDAAKEKARLLKAQADMQELKNAQARGELVPIDEVGVRWADIIAQTRSRMLAVPGRVRDAVPGLTATDVTKIDAEIRKALAELGRAEFI